MNSILACQSWRDLQGLHLSLEPDGARSCPERKTLGSKAAHAGATKQGRKPGSWYQTLTDCLNAGTVISSPNEGPTGPHYTQTRIKEMTDCEARRLPSAPGGVNLRRSVFPHITPGTSCLLCVGAFVHQIKITRRLMENSRPCTPPPPPMMPWKAILPSKQNHQRLPAEAGRS